MFFFQSDEDTRVLDISSNTLGVVGASQVGQMMARNQGITELVHDKYVLDAVLIKLIQSINREV